jgi:GT2 family glycosyltransferase
MNIANQPLVSVVILNWNGLENTKLCLDSVFAMDYPNFEVIVVDNGSTDGSKEYLSSREDIIYIDNPKNRGFTGGHIDGIKVSQGQFVMLLNNDALVKPDILNVALPHFNDSNVAAVGGRAYRWDKKLPPYNESNPFYSYQEISPITAEATMLQFDHGTVQEVNNVSGACVVINRAFIDEVGYLYEKFFAYYEETDLFARAKRAGYKVLYDPSFCIWHLNGASTSDKKAMFYYLIFRNRFIFAVRNFDQPFLTYFFKRHLKSTLKSALRFLLHRDPMDSGMVKAFFGGLWYLPKAWATRQQLFRDLPGGYNHKIINETPNLVSVAIDCRTTTDGLDKTLHSIAKQSLPYIDTLIVLSNKTADHAGRHSGRRIRYVIDKERNKVLFENFGRVLAKGRYMAFLSPGEILPSKYFDGLLYACMRDQAAIAVAGEVSPSLKDLLNGNNPIGKRYIIDKEIALAAGGYDNNLNPSNAHLKMLATVAMWKRAVTIAPEAGIISNSPYEYSSQPINDTAIKKIKNYARELKQRHSRYRRARQKLLGSALRVKVLYWPYVLLRWVVARQIPLRAKLGRIKAMIRAIANKRALTNQLKHCRNEFIKMETESKRKMLAAGHFTNCETPIFIICRDRLSALEGLINWLEQHELRNIILVDNQSTYPPLLDFFITTTYQVLRLDQNLGHKSPWTSGAVQSFAQDAYYVVNDPDVIPAESCPHDVLDHFWHILNDFPVFDKVGLGLKIDDLPNHYSLKKSVIEWEGQFWEKEVRSGVYEAGVDTTFALYRPNTDYFIHPSLRTGHPYVARHLPWYTDSSQLSLEDRYYRNHANQTVNSWDTDSLPERYAKELAKQQPS